MARLLTGMEGRWATAEQMSPLLRQDAMESCFCLAVIRRLVLVGLITDDHSEGHGVTPIDLSTKQRQPQGNHCWVS